MDGGKSAIPLLSSDNIHRLKIDTDWQHKENRNLRILVHGQRS